jgi:hypothetical protein
MRIGQVFREINDIGNQLRRILFVVGAIEIGPNFSGFDFIPDFTAEHISGRARTSKKQVRFDKSRIY